eukprot:CAMPEP_0115233242 /NCGR_PEP_ID=MMETSP0270-20121206/34176_1 /TAXON_ID=71861 /ORGANISM="Scrippsiella trochoidea, Strain CCMP3099" /LENGTH=705 /DNA_ID=CAMNT_0002647951 /DNA_START=40 /DNA_END=2155 /DNA_ORIENTATION=+
MMNAQAIADYLASAVANCGTEDSTNLTNSLLSIANSLAAQQRAVASAVAQQQATAAAFSAQPIIPALQPLVQQEAGVLPGHPLQHQPVRGPAPRFDGVGAPQPLPEPEVPDADTLAEGIKAFVNRYPIDTRAYEYLVTSPPAVVAHVLRDFRPPREGEADYSGLITTYVKRTRGAYSGTPGGDAPRGGSMSGPRGGAADPSIIGTLRRQNAGADAMGEELTQALQEFIRRYPVDEKAASLLALADPAVQLKVLQEFRPQREGDADYSALLTTYTKKSAEQMGIALQLPLPPLGGVTLADSFSSNADQARSAIVASLPPGGAPRDLQSAQSTPGLDTFFLKYPVDERAYDFFACSSPEVQAQVLQNFRPMREGEASYSGLFTSFVKKCRTEMGGDDATSFGYGGSVAAIANTPAAGGSGHIQPHGGQAHWQAARSEQQSHQNELHMLLDDSGEKAPPDLDGFRARFPMDERAFDFLSTAPREVQERVMETFVPQRLDDIDFSAPITAYVKALRNQLVTEGSTMGPATANDDEALAAFLTKYPCDARAQDFLQSSSPDIRSRVMREFRPRAEGDSDYSAAVTSFVKRLRNFALEDQNKGGGRSLAMADVEAVVGFSPGGRRWPTTSGQRFAHLKGDGGLPSDRASCDPRRCQEHFGDRSACGMVCKVAPCLRGAWLTRWTGSELCYPDATSRRNCTARNLASLGLPL